MPAPRLSGTIVMAIHRPTFVVLGADQLEHGTTATGAPYQALNRKVILHPTLPLAFATAGYANFLDERRTTDYLGELIRHVSRPADLTLQHVCRVLIEALQPLTNLRHAAALMSGRAGGAEDEKLDVLIALVRKREASFGLLRLTQQARLLAQDDSYIGAPREVQEHFAARSNTDLYADALTGADAIAAHVRRTLTEGIAAAALRVHAGQQKVGGPIDIAIVDAAGARLVAG